jgi:hypothetical protein
MPISEKDITRSAKLLVMQYGERAGFEMRRRMMALVALGDFECAELWRRILEAICALGPEATPVRGDSHPTLPASESRL